MPGPDIKPTRLGDSYPGEHSGWNSYGGIERADSFGEYIEFDGIKYYKQKHRNMLPAKEVVDIADLKKCFISISDYQALLNPHQQKERERRHANTMTRFSS